MIGAGFIILLKANSLLFKREKLTSSDDCCILGADVTKYDGVYSGYCMRCTEQSFYGVHIRAENTGDATVVDFPLTSTLRHGLGKKQTRLHAKPSEHFMWLIFLMLLFL